MSRKKIKLTLAERRERLGMSQDGVALVMCRTVAWVAGAERGRMSTKVGRELRVFIVRTELQRRRGRTNQQERSIP